MHRGGSEMDVAGQYILPYMRVRGPVCVPLGLLGAWL